MRVRFGCCGAPRPDGYAHFSNAVDVRGYGQEAGPELSPPPDRGTSLWKWALVLVGAGVATHVANKAIDGATRRRGK